MAGLHGLKYKGPPELAPDIDPSLQTHPDSAEPAAQIPMKLMALQLLLWQSALWTVQGTASNLPQSFLPKSFEQVRKIQADVTVMQEMLCATHKLCHPEELLLLSHSLGIPRAPLTTCSSWVSTDCLRKLHSGLFLYQGLLQALAGISPQLAPTLEMLKLDITDFATNIWQQMEVLGMAPAVQATHSPLPTFTSAFQRRAGGVLVASNLKSFLEQAHRALRFLSNL
ncbi:granulocyte colony-stimulating factor [Saccopteryx bilineata]|uniref:granulocyte colony-stimulating factor n=1 Tax=Saccopteryx bilineata TaxID=59482 RepID=UPI00338FADC8